MTASKFGLLFEWVRLKAVLSVVVAKSSEWRRYRTEMNEIERVLIHDFNVE